MEARATTSTDPLIGKIVSERYRVLERIGRGGFGTVYRVQHVRLDRILALKVLFEHSLQNPRTIKRFEREARATCRIGHENIVEITDFARDAKIGYYYVMEFLEGETLAQRLKALGPMSMRPLLHIALQMCDALATTHVKGIVHRDLKPDNVFLVRRPRDPDFVKILDFGIAAIGDQEEDVPRLTRHGIMLGTPAYMAPEQAEGQAVDHRADIYSFGILLYEMATGQLPFKSGSVVDLHRPASADPPSSVRPDLAIPAALDRIVVRALRRNQSERYQHIRETFEDLRALQQELGLAPGVPAVVVDSPPPLPRETSAATDPEWLDDEAVILEDEPTRTELDDPPPTLELSQEQRQRLAKKPSAMPPPPRAGSDSEDAVRTVERSGVHVTPPATATPSDRPLDRTLPSLTPPALALGQPAPVERKDERASSKNEPTERVPRTSDAPRTSLWDRPWLLMVVGFAIPVAIYASVQRSGRAAPTPPETAPVSEPAPPPPGERAHVPAAPAAVTLPKGGRRQAEDETTRRSDTGAVLAHAAPAPVAPVSAPTTARRDEPSLEDARRTRRDEDAHAAMIVLELKTEPPGATIEVTGSPKTTSPATLRLPRGPDGVDALVTLPGYAPLKRRLATDRDATITLKLVKKGKGGGGTGNTYDLY